MKTRESGMTSGTGHNGQWKRQSFPMSPPPCDDSPTDEEEEKRTFASPLFSLADAIVSSIQSFYSSSDIEGCFQWLEETPLEATQFHQALETTRKLFQSGLFPPSSL